jgi:nucleotide-binding universal stress UspA family protein
MLELNEILVPVDLSAPSRVTFARARQLVTGEQAAIVLLYVIAPDVVEAASLAGLGSPATIRRKLRMRAQAELEKLAGEAAEEDIEVTTLIAEGIPFYEIVRHAEELDVDAVVIGRAGTHDSREVLFFGSTAEKVVRACRRPVIVLGVEPVVN